MSKTIPVYSAKKATKATTVKTPKEFSEPVNMALLAQAVHVYQDRQHLGLSRAKTRGEVSITKAKIYRQKGTGNARHGAASAPIFVGGGKAHGPKGVKRTLLLPKKMRQKALRVSLSAKQEMDKVIFAGDLSTIKSTKSAQEFIKKVVEGVGTVGWRKISLFLANDNASLYRYFKNIENVKTEKYSNANAFSIFRGGLIVIDQDALKTSTKKTK